MCDGALWTPRMCRSSVAERTPSIRKPDLGGTGQLVLFLLVRLSLVPKWLPYSCKQRLARATFHPKASQAVTGVY